MQRETFDIGKAPVHPLRAERRVPPKADTDGHIRGVEASSGGLIRATLGSAAAAGAILVLFWLPAEYGVDATGLGRVMGLTQMGEIKQELYAEAEADVALAATPMATALPPASAAPEILERLATIEAQIAAIATAIGAVPPQTAPAAAEAPAATPDPAPAADAPGWRDEVSYVLAPTEGIEIKLVMKEGATARFEWTANGAVLNYDTHGDGNGNSISYEQGRGVPDQSGELTAAFTGNHGWFWRNRGDAPVTVTLRVAGAYSEVKRFD